MANEAKATRIIDESTKTAPELLAEIAQALQPKLIPVLNFKTKAGGVELPGQGTQTFIAVKRSENRPVLGAEPTTLRLGYDTQLRGIHVSYKFQGKDEHHFVPEGHIERIRFDE